MGTLSRSLRLLNLQSNQVITIGARCSSSTIDLIGNAGKPKMDQIGRAVKLYLERADKHNQYMKEQIHDFEVGKRHLANIMSINPDEITQAEINKAITYLLPSGLFSKYARPVLKHPLDILPKFKAAEFDNNGRPYSSFFYTCRKNLAENLHLIATKTQELKDHEDKQIANRIKCDDSKKILLTGSEWRSKTDMEVYLKEGMFDPEYKSLIGALENITRLPYSYLEKDFIFQYRTVLMQHNKVTGMDKKEPLVDKDGRVYSSATGNRKSAKATVEVYTKGTGKVTVNGEPFLEYFPDLFDREQVLSPIHLVGKLLKMDIIANVEGGGRCGQAGAVRHAISMALIDLVSEKDIEHLRLAGLLKRDPRKLERMKPGQPGARRKPTWKKR